MALGRAPRGAHSGGTCERGARRALGSDVEKFIGNNQGTAPRGRDAVPVQPVSGLPSIRECTPVCGHLGVYRYQPSLTTRIDVPGVLAYHYAGASW